MEKQWTTEQKEVINHRNGNLLVSAGAGAGKTAVLVERILSRLLDESMPIGLDEFLVVTFTRASAAEMKERIGLALEKKLASSLENEERQRLLEQYALLPQAEISTIDSFCKSVIMENFQKTDLDPSFRIADEAELQIMKAELIEEFLEERYEKAEEKFLSVVEFFERGKKEGKLGELILEFLSMSESFPNQEKWYEDRMEELKKDGLLAEGLNFFLDSLRRRIQAAKAIHQKALSFMYQNGGPLQYEKALLSDQELLNEIEGAESIEDLFLKFSSLSFETLGRGKPKDKSGKIIEVDEELQNKVKKLRDSYKSLVKEKLKERYFNTALQEIYEEEKKVKEVLLELLKLSLEFKSLFSLKKRKKNLVDFSDLSHIALQLLRDKKERPTKIAEEYRELFSEIMIDEYQDSNLVQELLLTAISRESICKPNLFMVGDVKQSIYGFRQAEPDIFLEKYNSYEEGGQYRKISLSKNFRSGKEVIDTVNLVFKKIMVKEIGGLIYDEDAALVVGRTDLAEGSEENKTEILLYDDSLLTESLLEDEKVSNLSLREKEAYMIGTRIRELIKAGKKYRDITILLRSMSDWGEDFKTILGLMGIPTVSETSSGYFTAWEVQVILDFLRIIDNPRQDIPLMAVLLSPIGGFTEKEIAEMKISAPSDSTLWEALSLSHHKKAKDILNLIEKKRREAVYIPIHSLLKKIYEDTPFYLFVAGMKGGEVRAANLDMLVVKAKDFEEGSLFGLNSFVRYIEKLRKYEKDFGEAEVTNNTEAVRIMSIHKSKGLEFNIVFVGGLSKAYNDMDARKMVVTHKKLGMGTDYFNPETREEGRGFYKSLIVDNIRLDRLSEEIRILYVALTRAKEKLILTGTMKEAETNLEKIREDSFGLSEEETYTMIMDSGCFMDLLLPTLLTDGRDFVNEPKIYGMSEIYVKEGEEISDKEDFLRTLEQRLGSEYATLRERELYREIEGEFGYRYPYWEAVDMKPSMTVSELKRLFLSEEEGYEEAFTFSDAKKNRGSLLEGFESYEPQFLRENEEDRKLSGSERGSLLHKFLKKVDFSKSYSKKEIEEAMQRLSPKAKLDSFDITSLYGFLKSDLAGRMREASHRKELYRETPFVLGVEKEVGGEMETVVIQGVIDAWFLENGEPVLVDYKSDKVKKEGGMELLLERYTPQLSYYGQALERITGKQVKEKLIYSLPLFETIKL